MGDVNSFLGPLFFILYLSVMVFVIMSMFVAITSNAMESVREEFAIKATHITPEMEAVMDDIIFFSTWLRRIVPYGSKLTPDPHDVAVAMGHVPMWERGPGDERKETEEEKMENMSEREREEHIMRKWGFEGDEREFIVSMKTPKLHLLRNLVAFEEQQRDMLHAIESLNRKARETALTKELELAEKRKNAPTADGKPAQKQETASML